MINLEARLRKLICQCIKEHKVLWFFFKANPANTGEKLIHTFLLLKIRVTEIHFLQDMHILQKKQSKKITTMAKVNICLIKLT